MASRMEVGVEFVSAGCNRVVNALGWGDGNILAYGAHNMLMLYDVVVGVPGAFID
jgi:hypothetical protein